MVNRLRELLQRDREAFGTWITLTDPAAVELLGLCGFDFVAVDLEHSAIGLETLQHHLRAAAAQGLATLVRVPSPDPKFLLRVLDAGAEGVLIPGVVDGAGATAALAGVRYPPGGGRGMSSLSRAARYGQHGLPGLAELAADLNKGVVAGLMVEDAAAVEAIYEIVATRGLDLVFIGPTDLSGSLGVLGSSGGPEVAAAVERVKTVCGRAGIPVAMPVHNSAYPLAASDLRSRGASLLTLSTDLAMLARGARQALDGVRQG